RHGSQGCGGFGTGSRVLSLSKGFAAKRELTRSATPSPPLHDPDDPPWHLWFSPSLPSMSSGVMLDVSLCFSPSFFSLQTLLPVSQESAFW
ncbi:hypothetical protein ACFL27_27115, partial [candidate division CSSED10-310 bacterium]